MWVVARWPALFSYIQLGAYSKPDQPVPVMRTLLPTLDQLWMRLPVRSSQEVARKVV